MTKLEEDEVKRQIRVMDSNVRLQAVSLSAAFGPKEDWTFVEFENMIALADQMVKFERELR